MAPSALGDINDFNAEVIREFRANRGRVGGLLAGTPLILVRHVGARSGLERVTPLAFTPEGDRRYMIVASNGGSPTHPSWYYNLKANPRIEVEAARETFMARAEELEGPARADRWTRLIAASPSLREFAAKTAREIPLLILTRED